MTPVDLFMAVGVFCSTEDIESCRPVQYPGLFKDEIECAKFVKDWEDSAPSSLPYLNGWCVSTEVRLGKES